MTGNNVCSQASQFLSASKLSTQKGAQLLAFSMDKIAADGRFRKAVHSLLSSHSFLTKMMVFLPHIASNPPEQFILKSRLVKMAGIFNSVVVNLGQSVDEAVERAILARLATRKEATKVLPLETRLDLAAVVPFYMYFHH